MTFNRQQTPVPVAGHPFVVEFIDPGTCYDESAPPRGWTPRLLYRFDAETNKAFVKRQLMEAFVGCPDGWEVRLSISTVRYYFTSNVHSTLSFSITKPLVPEGKNVITDSEFVNIFLGFSEMDNLFATLDAQKQIMVETTGVALRHPSKPWL